jgi:hypothetical protein
LTEPQLFIEVSTVNDERVSKSGFFVSEARQRDNELMKYIQTLHSDAVSQLSKPDTDDALQLMEQNISGLLGHIPQGGFNVEITTDRENLGRLLASAMMGGYFLRNAEQRFAFEQSLESIMSFEKSPQKSSERVSEQSPEPDAFGN